MFAACGIPQEKFRAACSAVDKLDKVNFQIFCFSTKILDHDQLHYRPQYNNINTRLIIIIIDSFSELRMPMHEVVFNAFNIKLNMQV